MPPGNNDEEAQTDTQDTENLVLNLDSEPSNAYQTGYYVYYRFFRKMPNQLLTITTESELKEWYLDFSFDIVAMTEQEEWS